MPEKAGFIDSYSIAERFFVQVRSAFDFTIEERTYGTLRPWYRIFLPTDCPSGTSRCFVAGVFGKPRGERIFLYDIEMDYRAKFFCSRMHHSSALRAVPVGTKYG